METTLGHVATERFGDDLSLRCLACGNTEVVKNYEGGKTPQKFVWLPFCEHGKKAYVKCEKCGKVYDEVYKYA